MLSTTPYLHAVSKATAVAQTFDVHAATLLKPRSVALTAMTEGPLQRILIVEFWVPHVLHLFRIVYSKWSLPDKSFGQSEVFRKTR